MLGRKKRRENTQSEESDNPTNKHLLEYQNKCLVTIIEQLEERLSEKTNYANNLDKRIESLSEVFIKLNEEIKSITETVDQIVIQNGIKMDKSESEVNNPALNLLSTIMKDIQSNSNISLNSLNIQDQLKSLIDNISGSIVSIVNNLMKAIREETNLKSENMSYEKTKENMANYFEGIKLKNEEMQKSLVMSLESNRNIREELDAVRFKFMNLERLFMEKENRIEELEKQKFNLMRKVNTNPVLPYINFEKKMFAKMVNDHQCLCHICGGEMNLEKKEEIRDTTTNNDKMILDSEQPENTNKSSDADTNNNPSDAITLLKNENESLKSKIRELFETNEKLRIDSIITEEKLRSSKSFKMLLSQAEQLVSIIDTLKESNSEMSSKFNELMEKKDQDCKFLEAKFNERINELDKLIFDQKYTIETYKNNIQTLNVKIESLENMLRMKENEDINQAFENYEREKVNMLKLMDCVKKQLKDYEQKYDEEFKKNKGNEEKIMNLEEKLEGGSLNPEKIIDKKLMKKNDQIKKLEAELKCEKEYKETYITELEVNEKSISELNKTIKNMSGQVKEYKEKIAKVMNDKIKDLDTFKRMNMERDVMDKKLKEMEERIEAESELNSKLKAESQGYKELVSKLEQELKFREEEVESLKKELVTCTLNFDQMKLSHDKSLIMCKELEATSSKHFTNFEHIKSKYEELCKLKNMDSKQLGKSIQEMEDELGFLQLENNKYRNMVKCNICRVRNKDSIVLKCFHMFCKECMDDTIKSRNRICPACKAKNITQNDVHGIYWD